MRVCSTPRSPQRLEPLEKFDGSLMCRLMALKYRVTQRWHQATKPPAHVLSSPNFYGNKVDGCGHLSPTKVPNFPNVVASSHVNGSLLQKWILRAYLSGVLLKRIKPTYIPRWQ